MLNMTIFNVAKIRKDFPILSLRINSKPLIYLDNAATTQKPRAVLDKLNQFYKLANANVHRGAHTLSNTATAQFEQARVTVAQFINAPNTCEIIWCKGTTEAINLVAYSLGTQHLSAGDSVLVSVSEHHANIVPWQQIAITKGAKVIPIALNPDLSIDQDVYDKLLQQHRPKIVALGHVSNALGTIHPIKNMIESAKKVGALTLVDGAQAIGHLKIDVQQLGCDFYCFSGHKCFGPTGIGVLWGKSALLEAMPVWQSGGEMIRNVSFSGTSFNALPFKFEAGTPPIANAIALEAALNYLNTLDREAVRAHEQQLLHQLYDALVLIKDVQMYSPRNNNAGVISFTIKDIHHQDISALLDQEGIALRSGHHCAMPLMESLNIEGTLRVSISFYNTAQEIDTFLHALQLSIDILAADNPVETNLQPNDFHPCTGYPVSQDVISTLSDATNWQQRFQYLLSLADLLPAPSQALICEQYQLQQCESGVWLKAVNTDEQLIYLAWSDARIMRGLLVLLIICEELATADIDAFLKQLKLSQYLSPSRTNGVKAIINAMQSMG